MTIATRSPGSSQCPDDGLVGAPLAPIVGVAALLFAFRGPCCRSAGRSV